MRKVAFLIGCVVMPLACLWVAARLFESWGAGFVLTAFLALLWLWRYCREKDLVPWLHR